MEMGLFKADYTYLMKIYVLPKFPEKVRENYHKLHVDVQIQIGDLFNYFVPSIDDEIIESPSNADYLFHSTVSEEPDLMTVFYSLSSEDEKKNLVEMLHAFGLLETEQNRKILNQ